MADKTLVDKTTYVHKYINKISLVTYTAQWCKPCENIKKSFPELLKNYTQVSTEKIDKGLFKDTVNPYIPFFVKSTQISTIPSFRKSIQTSSEKELQEFLIDTSDEEDNYDDNTTVNDSDSTIEDLLSSSSEEEDDYDDNTTANDSDSTIEEIGDTRDE